MPSFPSQDRLIRKETALGTLREMEPPEDHIGVRLLAPWMEVPTDDVIFDYARQLATGLAPARAEDAESELAQKDILMGGTGRASVIDWALKDYYTASDVSRYREAAMIAGRLGEIGVNNAPLTIGTQVEDFRNKVARDEALRRRKLDNRVEWMTVTPIETGGLTYNDGKIKFTVDYGRPANQTDEVPPGGLWTLNTSDPVGDSLGVQDFIYDLHGVRITWALASRKVINSLINSDRFVARYAPVVGGTPTSPIDPAYIVRGWGRDLIRQAYEAQTGIRLVEYDSVYRTRAIGSTTFVNNRYLNENKIYFMPEYSDLGDLDDTGLGFGRTLTSPHPEGNWTPGFYEWEEESTDPWGTTRGTGVKAFPVYLHLDKTYTMSVLA
jgi:hypothetical protein